MKKYQKRKNITSETHVGEENQATFKSLLSFLSERLSREGGTQAGDDQNHLAPHLFSLASTCFEASGPTHRRGS